MTRLSFRGGRARADPCRAAAAGYDRPCAGAIRWSFLRLILLHRWPQTLCRWVRPPPAAVPAAPEAPLFPHRSRHWAAASAIPAVRSRCTAVGRSVSEMLDDMLAETPAAPAQPVVEAPAPASDPYTAAPQPYQSAPAMTRPAAETTQSSHPRSAVSPACRMISP